MDGKITLNQILLTLVIALIACGMGLRQGRQIGMMEALEQQQIDAQEKVAWDIEVKKMEEVAPKWEIIKMSVTAYCPCEKCCEKWGKIPVSSGKRKTASGHTIHVGDKFVAAPRNYPFGTEMVIEGYAGGKIVKVEDVGGAIKGNKLDLYFDKHNLALDWGIRDVFVKVRVQG